jgi:CRP-like cAMP-binding protein
VACSSCNLRELCLPVGMSNEQLDQLDNMVATRRTVARGDTLFRAGDAFQSLYAVRTGFFKTCVSSEDGRDQVTASRWPANCSAWTASAPTATPATRWRWKTRRSA